MWCPWGEVRRVRSYDLYVPVHCRGVLSAGDSVADLRCYIGPRCEHQYCWICFADYEPIEEHGNDHHRADCVYHSGNLPAALSDEED